MATARKAYSGTRRQIVLAFDVGTTFSGISYSILDPGQMPSIEGVTRFPAQEQLAGSSKIPTIIYYDRQGKVRAIGAEATKDGIFEDAQDNGWVKAEWFKMHLRSRARDAQHLANRVPPLPKGKTVVDVFADFLRYLKTCAENYIKESHPNGINLWQAHGNSIHYVLSHPNGWETREQNQMRQAAIKAGLVPDTSAGHARISYVTEGEASLHFAIENGALSHTVKGEGIVIVDAGGGTIDISTYRRNDRGGKRAFEEIAAAQCHFYGSVFVTTNARTHLQSILRNSIFIEDLDLITQCFDKTTKSHFRNIEDTQFIRFGSNRDNDAACNIRNGQMKLPGKDVAKFFDPSIDCIVDSVKDLQLTAKNDVHHVVLVGGFAASDWLFHQVRNRLEPLGIMVTRPDHHTNKAVSEGAISFYLDHYVRTRVSKLTYGCFANVIFDPEDPEHQLRQDSLYTSNDGNARIPGRFFILLPKNTQVSETKEFRDNFVRTAARSEDFSRSAQIWIRCYRGPIEKPEWRDVDEESYDTVCTIVVDLTLLPRVQKTRFDDGSTYYEIEYEIVILFGLTELQAQVSWKEDGLERRSPASLVFEG